MIRVAAQLHAAVVSGLISVTYRLSVRLYAHIPMDKYGILPAAGLWVAITRCRKGPQLAAVCVCPSQDFFNPSHRGTIRRSSAKRVSVPTPSRIVSAAPPTLFSDLDTAFN